MSILYCSVILIKEKVKLSESIKGKEFLMQIKSLHSQIFKGSQKDRIPFDNYYLTYTKTGELVYLCVSPKKVGEERPRLFIETLFSSLNIDISVLLQKEREKKKSIKELVFQSELQGPIEKQIGNFNTGLEDANLIVREVQKDVDEIRPILNKAIREQAENITDIRAELLPMANNIKNNAKAFKKDARELEGRTRFCCKPWVIRSLIVLGSILLSALIYIIVALVRCSNLNAFC